MCSWCTAELGAIGVLLDGATGEIANREVGELMRPGVRLNKDLFGETIPSGESVKIPPLGDCTEVLSEERSPIVPVGAKGERKRGGRAAMA